MTAAYTPSNATWDAVNVPDNDPEMITAVIAYLTRYQAIAGEQPTILLAEQHTPAELLADGINIGNWDPECRRPLYLMILHGTINDGFVPGIGRNPSTKLRYAAFVSDVSDGVPGEIFAINMTDDGSTFKHLLNDPTLPDPEHPVEPIQAVAPYPPCQDVTITGN